MKGDARQSFMSDCLKGGGGDRAAAVGADRKKACNAQADSKKLAGAARNSVLTKCVAS